MAKPKPQIDTSLVCWIPTPDDYQFIPLQHLNGHYVAGDNAVAPVYISDGPRYRRQRQQNIAHDEFKKRLDEGEHLYPQPEYRRRSFTITDRRVYHFGNVTMRRTPKDPEKDSLRLGMFYQVEAAYLEDDVIDVDFHTNIDARGANPFPLAVIP